MWRLKTCSCFENVSEVTNYAQDEWRAHGGDGEVGLLLREEVPCRTLGECLAGAVAIGRVFHSLFRVDRVPVFFAVGVLWPVAGEGVDDRGEGGGDDHALDGGC